jgi:hypothetical protein
MMRRNVYGLVIALAAAAGGCNGRVNDELVGKWQVDLDTFHPNTPPLKLDGTMGGQPTPKAAPTATTGGQWQFSSDGSFSIDAWQNWSRDSSGKPKLESSTFPLFGKWSEKDGTVTLKFEGSPKHDNAEFGWKKAEGRLQLTPAGQTRPAVILKRADEASNR